jgi:hypothetical protein
MKKLRWLRSLHPLMLMTVIWMLLRLFGVEPAATSMVSWIVFIPTLLALVWEFRMSMDIGSTAFSRDVLFAILTIAMVCIVMTWIVMGPAHLVLLDILMALVAFIDAWVCTTNSFCTALRNLSGNINQSHSHDSGGEEG